MVHKWQNTSPREPGNFPIDTSYTIRGERLTVQIRRFQRSNDEWILLVFGLPVNQTIKAYESRKAKILAIEYLSQALEEIAADVNAMKGAAP
jgi:hypothetical protein